MANKKYRPKSGNEGLTVEFPTTEGYVTIKPSDWPYTPKDASEEAHLDNLDEVTDRPPPSSRSQSASALRAKKARGASSEGSEDSASTDGPGAGNAEGSANGNDDEGGEG